MPERESVTGLLLAWKSGDESALEAVMPLVENELRRIAARHMRGERPNHTLQTTALVNEAYMRLVKQEDVEWHSRAHFYAIASRIMRRILIDHAKSQQRKKRGGKAVQIELTDVVLKSTSDIETILELDEALERLSDFDPLKCRIVEMRHFGGMSVQETAEVLGLAEVTVMRHWSMAKAWLRREIA